MHVQAWPHGFASMHVKSCNAHPQGGHVPQGAGQARNKVALDAQLRDARKGRQQRRPHWGRGVWLHVFVVCALLVIKWPCARSCVSVAKDGSSGGHTAAAAAGVHAGIVAARGSGRSQRPFIRAGSRQKQQHSGIIPPRASPAPATRPPPPAPAPSPPPAMARANRGAVLALLLALGAVAAVHASGWCKGRQQRRPLFHSRCLPCSHAFRAGRRSLLSGSCCVSCLKRGARLT